MRKNEKTKAVLLKRGTKHEEMSFSKAPIYGDSSAIALIFFSGVFATLFIRKYLPGKRLTADGYVRRKPVIGREQLEHRATAEKILRRRLYAWEVVHHINGSRRDNRPENLCVMPSFDHHRYHDWYDWVFKTHGKYPRRETQLRKLRESFSGILLMDVLSRRSG